MAKDSPTIKERLIEHTPLLQLIQHYQYDTQGEYRTHFNTDDGKALPQKFAYGQVLQFNPHTNNQQMLDYAVDSLTRVAARDLTFRLGGKHITDMVHVPEKMQLDRDWVMLCSHDTFYRFIKAESYSDNTVFNPVAQRYYYDGLRLQRHDDPTDIFIHTKRSHVFNFDVQLAKEIIEVNIFHHQVRYELRIRGYWLITTG